KKLYYHWFLNLESVYVLNYIPYNKEEAKKIITAELSWRDYGGKHYESVFTKFYQVFILPVRFGIDKRKAHLSNLICSGQITKKQAFEELEKPLYESEAELAEEKHYILKKLGLSEMEFDRLMAEPSRKHEDFKTEKKLWERYFKMINILKFKFR
ncbi:MAG: N-acetyl sugar amidotransferase, partial [Bacteroidia bacterium]|nr:N-acetyl sugar amidotransferase [Bacteroidia bacterium]